MATGLIEDSGLIMATGLIEDSGLIMGCTYNCVPSVLVFTHQYCNFLLNILIEEPWDLTS